MYIALVLVVWDAARGQLRTEVRVRHMPTRPKRLGHGVHEAAGGVVVLCLLPAVHHDPGRGAELFASILKALHGVSFEAATT
jgi:hypothetical protein